MDPLPNSEILLAENFDWESFLDPNWGMDEESGRQVHVEGLSTQSFDLLIAGNGITSFDDVNATQPEMLTAPIQAAGAASDTQDQSQHEQQRVGPYQNAQYALLDPIIASGPAPSSRFPTSTQVPTNSSIAANGFNPSDLAFNTTDEAERAQCPRARSLRWDPSKVNDASYPTNMLEEKGYVCQILTAMHDFSNAVDNTKIIKEYQHKVQTAPKEIETTAWILLRGVRKYHDRGGPLYDTKSSQPTFEGDFAGHITSLCDNLYSVSKTACRRLLGKFDVVTQAVDDPVTYAARAVEIRKENARKADILEKAKQTKAEEERGRKAEEVDEGSENQAAPAVTQAGSQTDTTDPVQNKRKLSMDDDVDEIASLRAPKRHDSGSRAQVDIAMKQTTRNTARPT